MDAASNARKRKWKAELVALRVDVVKFKPAARPVHRDQRFTAIGQNQNELQSTFAMNRSKNVQRPALERMASTDNGHSLRKVLMMGSVLWLPSII